MSPSTVLFVLGLVTLLALTGCESASNSSNTTTPTSQPAAGAAPGAEPAVTATPANDAPRVEPDHITVQHILIGFRGSVRGKNITRTKDEARALAESLLDRARKGEDFDALVREFTDDAHPGIYKMANLGVPGDPVKKIYPRDKMVPAFGDTGFPLEVGGIGMAGHDARKSPYGWHIVKRVE